MSAQHEPAALVLLGDAGSACAGGSCALPPAPPRPEPARSGLARLRLSHPQPHPQTAYVELAGDDA